MSARSAPSPITRTQRLISSCTGALLTSFFVTPLDVIKVRLQAQAATNSSSLSSSSATRASPAPSAPVAATGLRAQAAAMKHHRCTHVILFNGLMDHLCPMPDCPFYAASAASARSAPGVRAGAQSAARTAQLGASAGARMAFTGPLDAGLKIIRTEGVWSLYAGLPPQLIMAVPATMLYFTAYEELRDALRRRYRLGDDDMLTPAVAGGLSRILSATVVSPIELVRTQMQSVAATKGSSGAILRRLCREATSSPSGFLSLWRGVVPTLFRDVPFSMMYWAGYEKVHELLMPRTEEGSQLSTMGVAFLSGLTSGSIAAAVTCPFDVVKTRMQIDMHSHESPRSVLGVEPRPPFRQVMRDLYAAEGAAGFFTGVVPRVARIAPSCAIMIASYEAGKYYFRTNGADD